MDAELTLDQKRSLIADGFLKLDGAVPPELVSAARRQINMTLGSEGIDHEQIVRSRRALASAFKQAEDHSAMTQRSSCAHR